MISTIWNNLYTPKPGVQILIGSNQALVQHQAINLRSVHNRGELAGILFETLTKVASPGADKQLHVFYAFSNHENRIPTELATGATEYLADLADAAAGAIRSYSLPILYQGGDWLHIWFTSDAFTDPSAQLEITLNVLAKTMD